MFSRVISRVTALLAVLAIVIVPTVMRARQHVERRDSTRLSIRLNWQGDTRPQRDPLSDRDATVAAAPLTLVQHHAARVAARVHVYDEPIFQSDVDNGPDLLRGPPAVLL